MKDRNQKLFTFKKLESEDCDFAWERNWLTEKQLTIECNSLKTNW